MSYSWPWVSRAALLAAQTEARSLRRELDAEYEAAQADRNAGLRVVETIKEALDNANKRIEDLTGESHPDPWALAGELLEDGVVTKVWEQADTTTTKGCE